MSIAYYNGIFSDVSSLRVPLSDRAIFFGDGVYDAAIGRHGRIYMERAHVERLFASAKALGIKIPYAEDELTSILREAVKRSCEDTFFLYFQVSRSKDVRTHSALSAGANLLITVTPYRQRNADDYLSLVTFEDLRYYYCNVKTLNLLPSVLAASYAEWRGADEAVFHRARVVTECAHSNISILKDGCLYTHPTGRLILSGTVRARLITECRLLGIPVKKEPFTLDGLRSADEIIVTSTTKLASLADTLDSQAVGGGAREVGLTLCRAISRDFLENTV